MNRTKTAGILLAVSVFCILFGLLFSPQLLPSTMVADRIVSSFPASLRHIGDGAFLNTGIGSVSFNEGLVSIGADAFKNADRMQDVYIPDSTVYIAKDAFPKTTVLHGGINSYARSWAEANGYRFTASFLDALKKLSDNLNLKPLLILLCLFVLRADKRVLLMEKHVWHAVKSRRIQDRPELYPINYRFP